MNSYKDLIFYALDNLENALKICPIELKEKLTKIINEISEVME